jgi:hypothetical protein
MNFTLKKIESIPSGTKVLMPSEFLALEKSDSYREALAGYLQEDWGMDPESLNIKYLQHPDTGVIYASVEEIPPTDLILFVEFTPVAGMFDMAGPGTIWRWVGIAGIGVSLLIVGKALFGKKKR